MDRKPQGPTCGCGTAARPRQADLAGRGIDLGRWSTDEPIRLEVAEDLLGPQITRGLEIHGP